MHITHLTVENVPPLPILSFELDKQVNLFIGPNASGKSTLLRVIGLLSASAREIEVDVIERPNLSISFHESGRKVTLLLSDEWPKSDSARTPANAVPLMYIPATRANMVPRNLPFSVGNSRTSLDIWQNAQAKEIEYARNRSVNEPFDRVVVYPEDELVSRRSVSHFSGNQYGIFRGYLAQLAVDQLRMQPQADQIKINQALEIGYFCAKSICPEIIADDKPQSHVEEFQQDPITIATQIRYGMAIGTSDIDPNGPLYLGDLSSGTQGTLLWVYALALKMATRYKWAEGWEKKPAILLIDEIENHLHPTWQRRVIPALLAHFPGLQIFATTHSPFVVAGLKAGQVHLLSRDDNGRVTATTNTEDVIGWTADEILRTMMGVDDPTDDATAAAARELRQLRQEPPRSNPEDEAQRQQRMQELRQQVDRDLLAGGPMEAQRELFEQQFADVMKRYRQNQELNQENG